MLSMLIAYNLIGEVIATLDYMVARDESGKVIGLIDFAVQEATGGLTDVWNIGGAAGSGTWPEWLGSGAYDFKVERANGRISALVHKISGTRRSRVTIEAAIAERIAAAGDEPADIRDLVGGPDRPLLLDGEGRTAIRVPVQRPNLPIIGLDRVIP